MKIIEKIKEIIKTKLEIKSNILILIATVYFGTVLNLSLWRFIFEKISITSFSLFIFGFSLIFFVLFPLYLIFNIIILKHIAKPLLVLLLILSSSCNYFMFNYSVFIDADMIRNIFETNTREATDLITFKSFLYVFFTGIIPAILVVLSKIKYSKFTKELKQRLLNVLIVLLITLVFGLISFKHYASFLRNNREIRKLINTINYNYSLVKYFKKQALLKREFIILDSEAKTIPYQTNDKKVFILVIGETARSKNFSLYGYNKNTNPLLSKEDLVVFKNTKACGTSTAISLPCIFSNQTKNNFDVVDSKYMENLVDIIKTAGYDVLWIENDDGCKGVCKNVETIDAVQVNNEKYCDGSYCFDEAVIELLKEKLKKIQKDTVIILHTMGSHGPTYYKRYPKEFEKFTPTCNTAEIQNCKVEEIQNTYDNTILYTDFVLSSVINTLKKYSELQTGMLYVSDHGESLGERNIYLHGLPYKIAPNEQKDVPMILWLSDKMKKNDFINYSCLKNKGLNNNYSHDNFFHSVLSILTIKTKVYQNNLDFLKNCRTKTLPF